MEPTLKSLTQDEHIKAEKTSFIRALLTKKITPYAYYLYLYNQYKMYYILEEYCSDHGLFLDVEKVKRSSNILNDLYSMEKEYGFDEFKHHILSSVYMYVQHIHSISNDKNKLLAHMYVRYMGDLAGGQIIKRFIPVGAISYYEFDVKNLEETKKNLMTKFDITMADEAKICFNLMTNFLEELGKHLEL